MNSTTYGAGVLGLSQLYNKDKQIAQGQKDYNQLHGEFTDYVFRAKSQIHGFRAAIHAHRTTEDELIAALKLENANHPLASREAVEAAVTEKKIAALVDPEVIKKTYPDGVLPEGAVIPPDLVGSVA